MGFLSFMKEKFSRKKQPVLGLALGSGGAKGLAHLGVLKAFEEENIRFSFVTGTSIGSIVGALYAKGYTARDMIEIIENLNRKEFAKNLRPFADMGFAEEFVGQYVEENIEELPVPYACWATDAETNGGVLLNSGKAARACCASSAIPPFFRGVEIDGRRLYDGAFTNAIPADVCKDLGAKFVVAVDLSAFTKPDEEKSRVARLLGSAINAFVSVKYLDDSKTRGYEAADFMLRPNLYDFRATDVSLENMNKMFEIGYNEAKAQMGALKEKMKAAGVLPKRS